MRPRLYNMHHGGVPAGAVDIMRPGPWANWFVVGKDGSRDDVVDKHARKVLTDEALKARIRRELRGRDLKCCCWPRRCHGDVLLKVANEDPAVEAPGD
jgi:uncharacterized protein DUF4326